MRNGEELASTARTLRASAVRCGRQSALSDEAGGGVPATAGFDAALRAWISASLRRDELEGNLLTGAADNIEATLSDFRACGEVAEERIAAVSGGLAFAADPVVRG